MAERPWPQFRLAHLLLGVAVLSGVCSVWSTLIVGTQRLSKKSDCKGNLKQLGNYLTLYVSRYGGDRDYPTTVALGGSGAPVPKGQNGAFWSWLYRNPDQTNAVSQRPGDDTLYACKTSRGPFNWLIALEYTCPTCAAVWPGSGRRAFPGGRMSEAVREDTPIGGDLIGPPDTPNHGGRPGTPTDDWNVLVFDGHVETVWPGSEKHTIYAATTTGVRTR